MVRQLLVGRPVHVLQVAGAEGVFRAVADEGDFQFHVEGAVVEGWPGEVREGGRALGGVWVAGEWLEGSHGYDPVADAGAETFGVERSLISTKGTR